MNIKPGRYSIKVVLSTILTLMTILSLSSCGKNVSPQSVASADRVKTATSKNLDRFLFQKNSKLGFIDRTGKIVIPPKFDRIDSSFSEGLAAVSIGEKWGYIDPMGKIVIPLKFDGAMSFKGGLGSISIMDKGGSDKWGYVDRTGKIVIRPQFRGSGGDFDDRGLAFIYNGTDSSSYTIDKTGKIVATGVPNPPDGSTSDALMSDGLVAFKENGRYGYKDRTGKVVIPAKFDRIQYNPGSFNDGLAPACLNEKCGYIDKTGKIAVPFQFDLVGYKFSDGLAWVNVGEKLGYIDKTGKFVIPARYRKTHSADRKGGIRQTIPTRYYYTSMSKMDCYNLKVPCQTSNELSIAYPDFDRGLALVAIPGCKNTGKKYCSRNGYIDTTGKLVFEF